MVLHIFNVSKNWLLDSQILFKRTAPIKLTWIKISATRSTQTSRHRNSQHSQLHTCEETTARRLHASLCRSKRWFFYRDGDVYPIQSAAAAAAAAASAALLPFPPRNCCSAMTFGHTTTAANAGSIGRHTMEKSFSKEWRWHCWHLCYRGPNSCLEFSQSGCDLRFFFKKTGPIHRFHKNNYLSFFLPLYAWCLWGLTVQSHECGSLCDDGLGNIANLCQPLK